MQLVQPTAPPVRRPVRWRCWTRWVIASSQRRNGPATTTIDAFAAETSLDPDRLPVTNRSIADIRWRKNWLFDDTSFSWLGRISLGIGVVADVFAMLVVLVGAFTVVGHCLGGIVVCGEEVEGVVRLWFLQYSLPLQRTPQEVA